MADTGTATDETDRLALEIERVTGGRVTSLERQARWRKAWYAIVEREDEVLSLYIRGDKQLDAEPFPGLDREAAILSLLERNGVPVPHVHGMAANPIGIIMDRMPGTRDLSEARDAAEQVRLAENYVEILAHVHRLDVSEFAAAGLDLPMTAEATALAYLQPHIPLYRRTKRTPQPLIEWALGWLLRNPPASHGTPRLVLGDPGQYLFVNGSITGIYDFEATHLGDPNHDLAALRTRHGTEPLGADPDHLIRHYAKVSGQNVDLDAINFHTASFMLASVMSLAGPLTQMKPGEMQLEYLIWDLMCRRALLWAIAERMGITIAVREPISQRDARSEIIFRTLSGTIARLEAGQGPAATMDCGSAKLLGTWAQSAACAQAADEENDLARASVLLGTRIADWRERDLALENLVVEATPDYDQTLLRYFAAQIEDQVSAAYPFRERLGHYALKPIVL